MLTYFLLLIKIIALEANSNDKEEKILTDSNSPHSRQKRLVIVTDDGRLGRLVDLMS